MGTTLSHLCKRVGNRNVNRTEKYRPASFDCEGRRGLVILGRGIGGRKWDAHRQRSQLGMGVRGTRGFRPEARPSTPLCTTKLGHPRHSWAFLRRVWKGHYPQNVEYVLSTPDRRTIPRRSSALSSVVPLKESAPQNRGDSSVSRLRLLMCWAARVPY